MPRRAKCDQPTAENPQTVPVARMLLMGAAVPKGDCTTPGNDGRKRSAISSNATLGWRVVKNSDVVLHSRDDEILGGVFSATESIWRDEQGLVSFGPHEAVGLKGGPRDRWTGEADSCGLKHDQYPRHPLALRHVAALFGPLVDRQFAERPTGERFPGEQQPDERRLESAPASG